MKRLLLLVVVLIVFGFAAKSQSPFQKEFHHFDIDTTITATVLYKDEFYCLRSDHQILVLNSKTNQIDSLYRDNSKEILLDDIYLKNDTLFGSGKYKSYYLESDHIWKVKSKPFSPTYLYVDNNFRVKATCSGEWGGSLYFIDRKTNKKYECSCQCALNVFDINGKYSITASLAHMSGFTNIFTIENPLKLKRYNRKALDRKIRAAKRKNITYIGIAGEDESKSIKGTKQLVDSAGITCEMSFEYGSKIYYIINKGPTWKTKDYNFRLYIDTLSGKTLRPVEDLTSLNISDYGSSTNRLSDDGQTSTFSNEKNTGFIYFGHDKLIIYSFLKKHN